MTGRSMVTAPVVQGWRGPSARRNRDEIPSGRAVAPMDLIFLDGLGVDLPFTQAEAYISGTPLEWLYFFRWLHGLSVLITLAHNRRGRLGADTDSRPSQHRLTDLAPRMSVASSVIEGGGEAGAPGGLGVTAPPTPP